MFNLLMKIVNSAILEPGSAKKYIPADKACDVIDRTDCGWMYSSIQP